MELADSLTPEMQVLLDCVRHAIGPPGRTELTLQSLEQVDREQLVALAGGHRVMPLLYKALKALAAGQTDKEPDEQTSKLLSRLKRLYLINAARNIRMTEELCRVIALFEKHGIRAIPIKGPLLAVRAYGDLAMRQFDDLDILLRREDMIAAARILEEEGYEPRLTLDPGQERAYVRSGQDRPFVHPERGIGIDLNSNIISHCMPQFASIDELLACSERRTIEGHEVAGLAPDDAFLTLCIHGAHHAWERLSWLADIAASCDTIDPARVREKARTAGLERAVDLAMELVDRMLGLSLPSSASVSGNRACPCLTHLPQLRLWRFQFGILDRAVDRLRFFMRRLFVPSTVEWDIVALPGYLAWLYCLIRPFRLLVSHIRIPRGHPNRIRQALIDGRTKP